MRTAGWPLRPSRGLAPTLAIRWASSRADVIRTAGINSPAPARSRSTGRSAAVSRVAMVSSAGTSATSTRSAPGPAPKRRPIGSRSSGRIRPANSRSASQVRLWVQSRGTFSLGTRPWLPGLRRSAAIAAAGTRYNSGSRSTPFTVTLSSLSRCRHWRASSQRSSQQAVISS